MGSNCSSGHRDQDSSSTKSEESPSYQIAPKTKESDFGLPPPVISQSSEPTPNSTHIEVPPIDTKPVQKPVLEVKKEEKSEIKYKIKKIIIYLCVGDPTELASEIKLILNEIKSAIKSKYEPSGFEVVFMNLSSKEYRDRINEKDEYSDLFLHELNRFSDGYLVPVVLIGSSVGPIHLPKTIEASDFTECLSNGCDLLSKWYLCSNGSVPPVYALQPPFRMIPELESSDPAVKLKAISTWATEKSLILRSLLDRFSSGELRDSYIWTQLEVEIQRTVLMSKETAKRTVLIVQNTFETDRSNEESCRRVTNLMRILKNELAESNILSLKHGGAPEQLKKLRDSLLKRLEVIFDSIIEENEQKIMSPLQLELHLQEMTSNELARTAVNRDSVVSTLVGTTSRLTLLSGPAGSGKSVICGKLSHALSSNNAPRVLYRQCNHTKSSSSLFGLLKSLIEQLEPDIELKSLKLKYLISEFRRVLCKADRTVLIIDGPDGLQFGPKTLDWLPKVDSIPESVRIFVAVRTESNSVPGASIVPIEGLTVEEAERIRASSFLEYAIHSPTPASHTKSPLQLKLTNWAKLWSPERVDSAAEFLHHFNNRLSDFNGKIGPALSLLVELRSGITDSDALEYLSSHEAFSKDDDSQLLWSLVNRLLSPFLHSVDSLISVSDSTLSSAIALKYETSSNIPSLVNYFQKKCGSTVRPYWELPYLQYKLNGDSATYNLDHEWAIQKLIATKSVVSILEDLSLDDSPVGHSLIEFYASFWSGLESDPRQLYSLLGLHLNQGCDGFPEPWRSAATNPPIPSLIPVLSETTVGTLKWDIVRRVDSSQFLTVSSTTGEIAVWDSASCDRLRSLTGLNSPSSVEVISPSRIIVLCDRELFVYDLTSSQLIIKLKGLMNTKMPFFGLHDSSHVVTLSRNRMYVNLMNLDSGDCVTTFKAGEDRFLNSLLVSEDGKTLVCGDETQKPFPLLVWNLASRKLLYDLRIPQHEFISKLSAITPTGSYVCCVAKEVVDNSPNYIVVYDLQSGTLFKKWKPTSETTSVQISATENMLVSGHADATILCWSLGTGNLKYSLVGHSRPVSRLRLSLSGRRLLSWTATRSDRSLRLWDLSTGSQLSVFTPEFRITDAELMDDAVIAIVEDTPTPLCLKLVGQGIPAIASPSHGGSGEQGQS